MTTPLITIDGITVRLRDRWLLNGLSWRINSGEQWAIVGSNGAGKTTLAKAIAGLLPVVQGKIYYHAFNETPPNQAIAYVASDARRDLWRLESDRDHQRAFAGRFNDATCVRELIGRRTAGRFPEIDARLADTARRFKLENLLDKPAMALSTGEMSRVLMARELIRDPKMLILDEPFEGLDQPGRADLTEMLDRLAASGLPTVLITHRPEEMLPATSHVLSIENGRIVRAGPLARPVRRPLPAAQTLALSMEPPPPITLPLQGKNVPQLSARLIDMQAVTVRYGDTIVLERFTWTVAEGQHWAIYGPNGAGKSTVLKLITGDCLQVHANQIRLFGRARGTGQTLGEIRHKLGVVSHDLAAGYQKHMSALDVVCSGFFDSVGLYRHCDAGQIATARRWLACTGLSALERSLFNHLSQGQRQMVLIARAMVKSPRLLILDEPCAGLDPQNRRTVLDLVENIGHAGSTGLIYVTHHPAEIPACTTHRLFLERGRAIVDS